jgi:hypothetical protein
MVLPEECFAINIGGKAKNPLQQHRAEAGSG